MNGTDSTTQDAQHSNPPAPAENPAENPEVIRKVYARDLRIKDKVHTVFRAATKTKQTARSGKTFLVVSLEDRTGEVDARVFDNIDAFDAAFDGGDFVLVQGDVIAFHGKPQLVIQKLEKLDPDPIDKAEFTRPAGEPKTEAKPEPKAETKPEKSADRSSEKPDTSRAQGTGGLAQLRELSDWIQDPKLRALVNALLDDGELAVGLMRGNKALANHLATTMRLAASASEQYPSVDRDLVIAGAFVHALGKANDRSDEARLVGESVLVASKIREKAMRIEAFPQLLTQHLIHLAVAATGAVEPVTVEAVVVAAVCGLDEKLARMLDALGRDGGGNDRWTDPGKGFDRPLWRGVLPTLRGKAPVEQSRKPRRDKPERPPRSERPERADRPERAERPERPERAEKSKPDVSTKLAFKPLAELARDEAPAAKTPGETAQAEGSGGEASSGAGPTEPSAS